MSESPHQYGRRSGNGLWLLVATAAVVVLLVFLMRDDGPQTGQGGDREMLVYCAAGVKKAVEEIAGKFEQEARGTQRLIRSVWRHAVSLIACECEQ